MISFSQAGLIGINHDTNWVSEGNTHGARTQFPFPSRVLRLDGQGHQLLPAKGVG